ncbi:MAG TPA: NRDE family protein [Novosphingobium sp.]|nr:NRDE family protein [Novosphingobium sp.]
MCVTALAWRAHPRWSLVAIGNRDEYHQRLAAPLAQWDDGSGIIAGRDLQSGGTWLGVTPTRFVLVTNLRGYGLPDPDRASRGGLVIDLLAGQSPLPQAGGGVQRHVTLNTGGSVVSGLALGETRPPLTPPASGRGMPLSAYNPFNLLLGTGDKLTYLTNRPAPTCTTLPHGTYGLSNGSLDEPWPKTLHLKAALTDWLAAGTADPAPLLAALACQTLPDIGLHPREPSDVAIEPAETPPFIRSAVYGTRCSTLVLVDSGGAGRIIERRFDADGAVTGETTLEFVWRE